MCQSAPRHPVSTFELVIFSLCYYTTSAVRTEIGHHHFWYIFQPYFMIQIQWFLSPLTKLTMAYMDRRLSLNIHKSIMKC